MEDITQKKDPYLSELDAMGDLEPPPDFPETAPEGEEPTRVDMQAPPPPQAPAVHDKLDDLDLLANEAAALAGEAPDLSSSTEADSEPDLSTGPMPVQDLLDLAPDLDVPVIVVMGRKSVTVKDLLSLKMGQVVDMNRNPTEPVDLVAAGRVIAKGELVEVDGALGVRILKLLK